MGFNHIQRRIPRHNGRTNSNGLFPDHALSIRNVDKPTESFGALSEETQGLASLRDIKSFHVIVDEPTIQGVDRREFVGISFNQVRQSTQEPLSSGSGCVSPVCSVCVSGRANSDVDVYGFSGRDGAEHLAREGILDLEHGGLFARDELVVYEEARWD